MAMIPTMTVREIPGTPTIAMIAAMRKATNARTGHIAVQLPFDDLRKHGHQRTNEGEQLSRFEQLSDKEKVAGSIPASPTVRSDHLSQDVPETRLYRALRSLVTRRGS
jgi:hypothetical protein